MLFNGGVCMKILIVDDEKSIRDLIDLTLTLENYTTFKSSDGQMAYDMI